MISLDRNYRRISSRRTSLGNFPDSLLTMAIWHGFFFCFIILFIVLNYKQIAWSRSYMYSVSKTLKFTWQWYSYPLVCMNTTIVKTCPSYNAFLAISGPVFLFSLFLHLETGSSCFSELSMINCKNYRVRVALNVQILRKNTIILHNILIIGWVLLLARYICTNRFPYHVLSWVVIFFTIYRVYKDTTQLESCR